MKFIHAADIHLDSPLRGLSAYAEAPAERLRNATREAFENLVQCALDEQVDFLVIAGDLYDGDWQDFHTGLFFVRQMGRLRQAGIPVFLLHGNHDAESEMTKSLRLPDNVHVFSNRKAESHQLPNLRVVLHGQSFKEAATTANLVPNYPEPLAGWLNIGVLHTALEGNAEHARYAPCSPSELRAKGYQYWALGHVHERWVSRGDGVTLAYPGNLQGRHIRETGARGALLVTAEDGEIRSVDVLETSVLRWEHLRLDVSDAASVDDVLAATGAALADLLAATPKALPLAVRVEWVGQSAAHEALMLQERQLRQEVLAKAVTLDAERIWIEKVLVSSAPKAAFPLLADEEAAGALAALAQHARHAADDPELVQALKSEWVQMLDGLPHELLQASPALKQLRADLDAQLPLRLEQALPVLLARVGGDKPAAAF